MTNKSSHKYYAFIQFLIGILILIFINILSSAIYKRYDLTKEKRFTLSHPTTQMISELEDIVYIKVYLEGDFPAGFKRLRNAINDMLNEFRTYGPDLIEYEFINPSESEDVQEKKRIMEQLIKKGLNPVNLKVTGEEEYSQKIIFPGAIISYMGKELPVTFLESQVGFSPQKSLNNSISLLEYKLANTISKLCQPRKKKIAFLQGHGELSGNELADISKSLSEYYDLGTWNIKEQLNISSSIDLVIIAKPIFPFNEKDKFKIDQYIMNGGRVMWFIESLKASLDSLRETKAFMALTNDLNLEDQLFKYGVRVNPNLIQDLQCNPIPVIIGQVGNVPQTQLYPWYYYPILSSRSNHIIVKNMDMVMAEFVSSIDTVGGNGIKKTVLLTSSAYCKTLFAPVRVHLSLTRFEPKKEYFDKSFLPVAVLLEGEFTSVFKNRLSQETLNMISSLEDVTFKEKSEFNKMIIFSDGDLIRNEANEKGMKYPLGYNQYSNQTFANKDLILNAIEYLCDNNGLIATRSKEVKLRMLDRVKVKTGRIKYQLINLLSPLILLCIFGLGYHYFRKRKYGH